MDEHMNVENTMDCAPCYVTKASCSMVGLLQMHTLISVLNNVNRNFRLKIISAIHEF